MGDEHRFLSRNPTLVTFLFSICLLIWCNGGLAFDLPALSRLRTGLGTSRQLNSIPPVGISVVSQSETDFYLINGESEELVANFIFMPPSDSSPEEYVMSFGCESDIVLFNDSCSITNTISDIVGTEATAYNTTVVCTFERFPAETFCTLTATSVARQLQQFPSESLPANVYGIVFYTPDQDGGVSKDAIIVSGYANTYELASYDRELQGLRDIPSYGIFPAGTAYTGSDGISFLGLATVSVVVDDYIFRYNVSECSITGAAFISGTLVLDNSGECGLGMAVSSETAFPILGAQFRPYKSGKFTLQLNWDTIGTTGEVYEQAIVFSVVERAPPVITSVEKQSIYQSLPCGTETLNVTGFNFRLSDKRELLASNEDGTLSVWQGKPDSFLYDQLTDSSSFVLESVGGVGRNVPFTIRALYGSDFVDAVYLQDDASSLFSLDFSTPPELLGITPNVSEPEGGSRIVLVGTFDGFKATSVIRIGGFEIRGSDVQISSSSELAFTSPPLSALGKQFSYNVLVEVCAERSEPFPLMYNVAPLLTITAADSSTNEETSYVIPYDGEATFVAEVSENNNGASYLWQLLSTDGEEIPLENTTLTEQIFTVTADMISPSGTPFILQATVQNSVGLSDTSQVTIELATPVVEFILVNVFEVEVLTRSLNSTTLVQASLVVETSNYTGVVLEWVYRNRSYVVDENTQFRNSSVAGQSVTGPTKLGLEFNIARQDLVMGVSRLELIATLISNPIISGRDAVNIVVIHSELQAIINDGLNGTLLLSGTDLNLHGGNSFDPDVLPDESNPTTEIQYDWFSCQKSLDASFTNDVEDCSGILPEILNSVNITILASNLFDSRLDDSNDPNPTFFSFGLTVSKDNRTAVTYSYFELRTSSSSEPVPALTTLEVVDSKGIAIDVKSANTLTDIVIQPNSDDATVSWSFDMTRISQQYLLLQGGVLKDGPGYVSVRGQRSRLPLAFAANSLEEGTEYTVQVSVYSTESSIVQQYEISFLTSEIPKLSCTAPIENVGILSETMFTISGQLSFEAQNIEYCFFLSSSPEERFSVGKGCSSVPFASFTFHREGIYQIECEARTTSGALVDRVLLNTTLSIVPPTPTEDQTVLENLSDRVANLTEEAELCEAMRDHGCLISLISVANSIAGIVVSVTDSDASEEAQQLVDQTQSYVANLSRISETLTTTTVYRPNQIATAIDLSFYLLLVPQSLFEDENTLFAALKQAESAIEITEDSTVEALVSDSLVEKVSTIANLSLATAFNIGQEGTSRRRLQRDTGILRRAYGVLLLKTTKLIASIRAQQETCGFSGIESTTLRESEVTRQVPRNRSDSRIPPVQLHVQVSCDENQVSKPLSLSAVQQQLCPGVLQSISSRRMVASFVIIPEESVRATGLLLDIDSRVTHCPILEVRGIVRDEIPPECFRVTMEINKTLGGSSEETRAGIIWNDSSVPLDVCGRDNCFIFRTDDDDIVQVTDTDVTISTKNQGFFIAGIPKERAPGPIEDIRGSDLAENGTLGIVLGIGVAFVLGTVLVTWFAATHVVVVAPSAAAVGEDWEYVERDNFGRGLQEDETDRNYRAEHYLPKGAKLPSNDST
ncbi:hypothetical protein BWQ96_04960 [Gracilariopsis chorda]|uniref:PKD/REJ-like domain-containing protein n=1 Tax=Gracilariopsis chorda TaxID=448386 RepID=A0A2V3IT18_9FLOR|nr:hypothetical protein BWQ96_04960 [Gracilariopsis chorda]|eukprot:PXF45261.1 hypothetical protein BWQ96_04960 [Gracilariopsis chorda]